MELRKNSVNTVRFYPPTPDTILSGVTVVKPDGTSLPLAAPAPVNGVYLITLPYLDTEGPVVITWNFTVPLSGSHTLVENHDVISPYVSVPVIREELDLFQTDHTEAQLLAKERKARRIINRHCHQSFGLRRETNYVRGSGSHFVNLPKRLSSVVTATRSDSTMPLTGYEIRNDGRSLRKVLAVDSFEESVTVLGPIFNPFDKHGLEFATGQEWKIDGMWGYESIPPEVRDATLLIIEQELCDDAIYREKFITSMTTADWRFEVSSSSWRGTGNAVADRLLEDFVWQGVHIL